MVYNENEQADRLIVQNTLLGESLAQEIPGAEGDYLRHYDLALLIDNVDFLAEESPFGLSGHFIKIEDVGGSTPSGMMRQIQEAAEAALRVMRIVLIPKEAIIRGFERRWHSIFASGERREEKALKRAIVCRHALEWDKTLYLDERGAIHPHIRRDFGIGNNAERARIFIEQVRAIDIWEGLHNQRIGGLDLRENIFWFAHPVYFAKTVFESGVLDRTFNPYEGVKFVFEAVQMDARKQDFLPLDARSFVVVSNPGFAPILDKRHRSRIPMKFDGHYFADCSSPYGVRRRGSNFIHSGVDFPTNGERTPIIALVHGVVWACSTQELNQFGKVMIIKGRGDDKLYFLAHLHSFVKQVGDNVKPRETVAITGNTTGGSSTSTGIHLHLEVYKGIPSEEDEVLNLNAIRDGETSRLRWWRIPNIARDHRVDPFDHNFSREL